MKNAYKALEKPDLKRPVCIFGRAEGDGFNFPREDLGT
jgi:hypothetical protein